MELFYDCPISPYQMLFPVLSLPSRICSEIRNLSCGHAFGMHGNNLLVDIRDIFLDFLTTCGSNVDLRSWGLECFLFPSVILYFVYEFLFSCHNKRPPYDYYFTIEDLLKPYLQKNFHVHKVSLIIYFKI